MKMPHPPRHDPIDEDVTETAAEEVTSEEIAAIELR
jgi:hypothetical protein